MVTFFYTNIPDLKRQLETFQVLNTQLISTLIPPSLELGLQWSASVNRAYHASRLAEMDIKRMHITQIIAHPSKISRQERLIVQMKYQFDLIHYHWYANNIETTLQDILTIIYALDTRKITVNSVQFSNTLRYIHMEADPIIQASLAYLLCITQLKNPIAPFVASLVAWLFLCKKGYDMRRMISIQNVFSVDKINYYRYLKFAEYETNITPWVVYFATSVNRTMEDQLTLIHDYLTSPLNNEVKLSEREVKIISRFSQPDQYITNRMVQNAFNVSQITASRDLSHLTSLGLLSIQGKGRSVKYIKII